MKHRLDQPERHADGFDYRAAFIGPQSENGDEMERVILDILRDHLMWRRNFHPEDPRLIEEWARSERPYRETVARNRDAVYGVLARLKRGAPLHSPRQLGHMVSDPSLPALAGYFAGLLYNQNNVVQEASPETVRCEREYLSALARMIGYPPLVGEEADPFSRTPTSFGHLASGGTAANMEALWIIRNVRHFPLSVRIACETHPIEGLAAIELTTQRGERLEIGSMTTGQLWNLPITEIVALRHAVSGLLHRLPEEESCEFRAALPSVRQLGLGEFMRAFNARFPDDPCSIPVVMAPVSAHYCWKKALDLTGLGSRHLQGIPVDDDLRLDISALRDALADHQRKGVPVLAVVSICGTTETATIDPVDGVQDVQADPEMPAFWHHCDAAFGGYLTSMVERAQGYAVPWQELPEDHPGKSVSARVYSALSAVAWADSVVLDPHKLGYLPYPSGAILLREYSVRDAIAFDAPYLAGRPESGFGGFLGRWTLEGSRPGAAAVSGYLAQSVVPLIPTHHGTLMEQCIRAHRVLFDALVRRSGECGVRFLPLGSGPDSMGTCFILAPEEGVNNLEALNQGTRRAWEAFTVDESGWNSRENDYLLSKSEIPIAHYDALVSRMLDGVVPSIPEPEAAGANLELLRILGMNPFLHELITHGTMAEDVAGRLFACARNAFTD